MTQIFAMSFHMEKSMTLQNSAKRILFVDALWIMKHACLLKKRVSLKYNKINKITQVTIMDDILKKQKHASHFERKTSF